jgi:hypothetical protein
MKKVKIVNHLLIGYIYCVVKYNESKPFYWICGGNRELWAKGQWKCVCNQLKLSLMEKLSSKNEEL